MMPNIEQWLAALGLSQYADSFRANHIDGALLVRLTADDLQGIGVTSLGHRIRMLDAVAALADAHMPAALAVAHAPPARPFARSYTPRHLADRILQSRCALEGERKQVSVLFADVKGSMELAEQLDPEQWHAILEGFFAILAEGVHRFEGTVNQYTGDGIMALFGAPIAHEDHAQRACFAALHLQREINRYATGVKREHGVGFSTRMGINSGEVVVGRIGDDLRMDYTAQGHTVGLAQRMEGLAEPNTCYLSAPTAALCAGYFALEDLGEFQVKGVSGPVRVHRLAGIGAARNRFDISRQHGLAPFVGRAADLRALDDALAQTLAGSAQAVGVVAEAGTGKSRLCFEFLERCRARGIRVFEGRAVAHGRNVPLLPILDIFRAVFGIGSQDDSRAAREKIAGRVVLLDNTLADVLPVVFDFMGVGDPQHPGPALDPTARQRRLVALLTRLVQGDGDSPASVTMVEDLHWIDAASGDFLEQLVEGCAGGRNMLLLNFRPEFHAQWMQRSCYRQLPLTPLGPDAMAELMAKLLGPDPTIAALAADIHARTGGNPFFAEEIAQSLRESGQLEGRPGAYRLAAPTARLDLPATVQSVLAARIDRLPEREKLLLQHASVIGKQFSEPLLAAVAGPGAEDLKAGLDALCRAEFLNVVSIYPVAEYAFKHPLTQEVALGGQLRERRRQIHAAVARAIELQGEGRLDEQSALLAHHWDETGDALCAARWHRRAAEWPGCPDFVSAYHHWDRVWTVLRALPQDSDAIELRIMACARLLTLGPRLGVGMDVSRAMYAEGESLADAIGDSQARIRLTMAYGWALASAGELAVCLEKLVEMQPLLEAIEAPALKVAAWGNLFMVTCLVARFREALDMVERGRALLAVAAPAGKGIGSLNSAASLDQFQGYCWAWMGRLPEALEAYAKSLHQADPVGELAVFARCHCTEAHYHAGDPQAAMERARQAEQISHKLGEPPMIAARVHQAFGYAHLAAGRAADAVTAARAALAIHRRVDQTSAGPSAALLAEALLAAGDFDAAQAAATEAISSCQYSLRANYEAIAQGVLARALLRRDGAAARDVAQTALDAAAALVERTGARLLAPALARWRAEFCTVLGDEGGRQHWVGEAARGNAEMGARNTVARVAP